jgi:hypothetical protein
MAEMGVGYGSEWHLLRWLGRHRDRLNAKVMAETGATSVRWLDFHFNAKKAQLEGEREGLDFLPKESPARREWSQYWPQTGTQQNWDAVGIATIKGVDEWLLVEAKAHTGELRSDCGADERGGLSKIRNALDELKLVFGAPAGSDWLKGYYQLANRLAVLNFLNGRKVPARLILLYFCGDKRPDHYECPSSEQAWQPALDEQARQLGLDYKHSQFDRVHKFFLPVIEPD